MGINITEEAKAVTTKRRNEGSINCDTIEVSKNVAIINIEVSNTLFLINILTGNVVYLCMIYRSINKANGYTHIIIT